MNYQIIISELSTYELKIEADTPEEAEEQALQMFYNLSPMQKENFLMDSEITDYEVEEY